MRNNFSRLLVSLVAFTLLVSVLSPLAKAKEVDNQANNQQNEQELEKVLKTLYDDAGVYDEKEQSLKFKDSVLRKELSKEQYNNIIGDIKNENKLVNDVDDNGVTKEDYRPDWRAQMGSEKQGAYVDKCVGNKLSNTYGKKAAKAVAKFVLAKNYKKAAKELAKRGLKATGNIGTLSSILGQCLFAAHKKFD
ncbi:hypothetical protein [Staphylococcus kloosii]|jgi:hypothetical protein|uniref:hypothetical protein n=1 Tax=Staphylococcus kloosii TaxID=29384 RepID=UPI00189F98E2|nr:hypothetical protein [Staphylococcus kloosii]MBF7026003.1 hypothetical protein [Staphylococcus kloosii]